MLIPSIDIMEGRAVQLRGGNFPRLDLGDPRELAARYARSGEIAVVDLDAALGRGDNRDLVLDLVSRYPARVGGGIRDLATATALLDAGARKLMLGTMATPDFLSQLPRDRLMAALDLRAGEVVVEGWTKGRGQGPLELMEGLGPYVSGYLVTFTEAEGSLGGLPLAKAKALIEAAGRLRITFAGGAATAAEIGELDRLGADVQAGTALALGKFSLAEALASVLVSDREDGLWPTLVCNEAGLALGLCWSSLASLKQALEGGRGVYQSRRRGLWVKGEESGAGQDLLRVDVDCDRDALRFTVRQAGPGFCHRATPTCFGEGETRGLSRLEATLGARRIDAPPGSYTRRLFDEPALLASKLREEAQELIAARGPREAAAEAADVFYFALVRALAEGASLGDIEAELDRRSLRVSRRGGAPKPAFVQSQEALVWTGTH